MDSSANQWLAQLENEELGELEFVDPLSMQQLAESLANELWQQPQEQQEQQDQQHEDTYHTRGSPTGFSFAGDVNKAEGFVAAVDAGSNSMFPFTNGTSGSLNFSALEQQQHGDGGAAGNCCLLWEKRGGRRPTSSVQEHVIAERKRREKMHQQFATLASIIPDITKTDKVSLLGSAIEYVHQLRERVKALQEHQSTAESPMFDARCCIGSDDQEDDEAASPSWVSPRIDADVRGTTVLLRIVCREKKGVLIMVLTELENHGLSVINTSVVPFADSSLNITISAEIEDGSSTTVELVKNLNLALQKF